jgi:hypothetical protein
MTRETLAPFEYRGWLRDRRRCIKCLGDAHGYSDEYANVVLDGLTFFIEEECPRPLTRGGVKAGVSRALARWRDLDAFVEAEWERRHGPPPSRVLPSKRGS